MFKNLVPSTKEMTSRKVRIKLSGNRTLIARGLNVVVVFAFTVLEEDQNPTSVEGCNPLAILKINENFESLSNGLQNIIQEAHNL